MEKASEPANNSQEELNAALAKIKGNQQTNTTYKGRVVTAVFRTPLLLKR